MVNQYVVLSVGHTADGQLAALARHPLERAASPHRRKWKGGKGRRQGCAWGLFSRDRGETETKAFRARDRDEAEPYQLPGETEPRHYCASRRYRDRGVKTKATALEWGKRRVGQRREGKTHPLLLSHTLPSQKNKILYTFLARFRLGFITGGGIIADSGNEYDGLMATWLEPNSTTRTPATDNNNGQAHNNSTTNLPHSNARAQHLDMSRCWDVANFCPLVASVAGVGGVRIAGVRVVEFGSYCVW